VPIDLKCRVWFRGIVVGIGGASAVLACSDSSGPNDTAAFTVGITL
jgi:hypothetical protein